MAVTSILILLMPIGLILVSYCAIAQAVLRINSANRWRKACGTCFSCLVVVTFFYRSSIAVYLQPQNAYAQKGAKLFCLFYAVGTAAMNPHLHLKTKEVKRAVRRLLGKDRDTSES
ncbi:Olfactory receptor 2H1 [Vulpes lagopus]